MTEREERIQDSAEEPRVPWIRPKLHRLDAGAAEVAPNPGNDGITSFS
jgi:hypothetical protein